MQIIFKKLKMFIHLYQIVQKPLQGFIFNTWANLANRYKASVRLLFESFSARIEKPATEPAKILLHHPLKQSHK